MKTFCWLWSQLTSIGSIFLDNFVSFSHHPKLIFQLSEFRWTVLDGLKLLEKHHSSLIDINNIFIFSLYFFCLRQLINPKTVSQTLSRLAPGQWEVWPHSCLLGTHAPDWQPWNQSMDLHTLTQRPPPPHPALSRLSPWFLLLAAGWPAAEHDKNKKIVKKKIQEWMNREELFLILFLGKWNFWTNSHCCCWFLVILKVTFWYILTHTWAVANASPHFRGWTKNAKLSKF